jgi:hypothetical protein
MCITCVVVTWYSMLWPAEGAVTTAPVTSGQVGREVEVNHKITQCRSFIFGP